MSRAVPSGRPVHRAPGPWLRDLLWQLLLLLCAALAIAVFAFTLMLPGMYSPHRARLQGQALPQVMLLPSSRAGTARVESGYTLALCQTRQAAFIC